MSDISDEYIAEAALVSPVKSADEKRNPFASLSRALNSGLGVACICFVVAIATIVGMVAWGRMGGGVHPAGTPSERFDFSYEIVRSDGSSWNGHVRPGETINVNTTVINRGDAFSYTGSSSEFCAHAQFVLQGGSTQALTGVAAFTDDIGTFKVETGEEGIALWHFVIPEDATPGVYDLVLSYDGEQETFRGALTVNRPYTATDIRFTFGYDPYLGNLIHPGSLVYLNTWVINDGDPFIFEGSSIGFVPTAALIHEETGYRIPGEYITTKDIQRITVNTGDRGEIGQGFNIPDDAPTGVYGLELSCQGESVIIPGVLTVAIRTRPDTPPYLEAGHPFSFGYESFDGLAVLGDQIEITAWVVNEGDSFSVKGTPVIRFAPFARLVHRETGFEIWCRYIRDYDEVEYSVDAGYVGRSTSEFHILANTPAGEYDLYLYLLYEDQKYVFENVLTVAVP